MSTLTGEEKELWEGGGGGEMRGEGRFTWGGYLDYMPSWPLIV
jgi:hypothetical protein